MEFYISKIVWALIAPSHLLIIFLALTLFLPGNPVGKIIIAGFITLLLLAAMMLPVGDWALLPLELCEGRPQLPPQVDGAIALGGAVDMETTTATGEAQFNSSVGRYLALLKLMKA